MADEVKTRRDLMEAQWRYESDPSASKDDRRAAFLKAREQGLTVEQMAATVDLGPARVEQILEGQ